MGNGGDGEVERRRTGTPRECQGAKEARGKMSDEVDTGQRKSPRWAPTRCNRCKLCYT